MILLYLEIHKNIEYVFFTIGFFTSSTVHTICDSSVAESQDLSFIYEQQDAKLMTQCPKCVDSR
jgi:hypothetical protein